MKVAGFTIIFSLLLCYCDCTFQTNTWLFVNIYKLNSLLQYLQVGHFDLIKSKLAAAGHRDAFWRLPIGGKKNCLVIKNKQKLEKRDKNKKIKMAD